MFGPLLLVAALLVRGESTCPRPADVAARLAALAPADGAPGAPAKVARVEPAGDSVRVVLQRPDGSVVGDRVLERAGSCDDLAAAAAVILASWDAANQPEYAATLGLEPRPAGRPAATARAPAGPRAPAGSGGDAGLGAGAALAGSHLAPALTVTATWLFWRSRLGVRASAAVTGWHQQALGAGAADWRRWPATAGAVVRLHPAARLALDLHAEGAAAWLAVRGRDFPVAHRHDRLALGLGGGARLALFGGRLVPWVALGLTAWPRAETALATMASATLPRLELGATVGASFAR